MQQAINMKDITKRYKLYYGMKDRILDLVTPKSYGDDFYALNGVDFQAAKGDVVGFIGINGSGKSTLSNIIAGIVPETSGHVEIDGQTSLIAVASGLKNDLTGRDNIELKCLMLGFDKDEIKKLEPDIIEFAELDNFIDQPVKSYSSGMRSRLGFAISVNIDPEILVIDEALSVGDKAFAEKSFNKMNEFKNKGKTIIFVSHSTAQMKQFCDKVLWLEYGTVKDFGDVGEVIPKYEEFLSIWKKMSKKERGLYKDKVLAGESTDEILGNYIEEQNDEAESDYSENPTSLLCHFKGGKSYIYSDPLQRIEEIATDYYKHSVYYVKKQLSYNDELYNLISNEPSAQQGVIGWVKASDVVTRNHVAIDSDPKEFRLKGTGAAFERPWGGKKNQIYADLEDFEDAIFNVDKTEKVGGNIWYHGILDETYVWIHQNHLKD
ncbi:MAG TPA: teichoic acids export ABC transporter ATP-binding subunit TagH [Lentibacillus sp.]|uniref:teichoic acids export ABC transporter ATP-binding subunit TagH n=1 Tax=Lentibacillus sp. TaxID=1925746 RepID=UPI002B4B21AC|nr:teichoic acids export ABC transporter ATP-binding subunit TagH [Lentibacillus sp.]HLR62779.1 teichoic acids export ABC transporter ATP-binding subunit TagH [Lentibacillus sp.]